MNQSILMIGYGAIAAYVADQLSDDDGMAISAVLARPGREKQARAAIGNDVEIITDIAQLSQPVDVAVECAGHGAVDAHAGDVLAAGIDLGIVSIGALAAPGRIEALTSSAKRGGAQLSLLSGAIGAVDAIASARQAGLDLVRYRGTKPPTGWLGAAGAEPAEASGVRTALFGGSARDAARMYPKNANVAATVAIAGLGFEATQVELIMDPTATGNTHTIETAGAFGRLSFDIQGQPLPGNPRSSALTAMSVLRFLRNRAAAIVI